MYEIDQIKFKGVLITQ